MRVDGLVGRYIEGKGVHWNTLGGRQGLGVSAFYDMLYSTSSNGRWLPTCPGLS
jgi:hypothetical protein